MRKDGIRLKNTNPMYTVVPYIMDKRYDAMNMTEIDIPVEPLQTYLNAKRAEGLNMSHLGVVLAAYLRMVSELPQLNRFIVNKRIYARTEFPVGMVVLKPGELDGTMSKMYFQMTDTIFDVHNKMNEYITQNRAPGDVNSTDDLIRTLLRIPGLCNFGVWLFKALDRYGLLPRKLIEASPFHCSLVVSNLASIRTNHIYHHIYEFGTVSVLITLGNMREVPKRVRGEIEFERCIPMGIVMDERICSGSYYSAAFKRFRYYLANPALLETPPEKVVSDLDS